MAKRPTVFPANLGNLEIASAIFGFYVDSDGIAGWKVRLNLLNVSLSIRLMPTIIQSLGRPRSGRTTMTGTMRTKMSKTTTNPNRSGKRNRTSTTTIQRLRKRRRTTTIMGRMMKKRLRHRTPMTTKNTKMRTRTSSRLRKSQRPKRPLPPSLHPRPVKRLPRPRRAVRPSRSRPSLP